MSTNKINLFVLFVFVFFMLNSLAFGSQVSKNFDPKNLQIKCAFIQNKYHDQPKFLTSFTIINRDGQPMPKSGWKIYFSLRYHGVLKSQDSSFTITHIEGDLFYFSPTAAFDGLPARKFAAIKYSGDGIIANYQDFPSGIFWVDERDKQHAIALNNVSYSPISTAGKIPYADAETIYNENSSLTNIPKDKLPPILPRPNTYKLTAGHFVLDKDIAIVGAEFKNEASYLSSELTSLIGWSPMGAHNGKRIVFHKNKLPDEAYDLTVTPDSVVIKASTGAGIFYGIQSLRELLSPNAWAGVHASLTIPCITIKDAPRFPLRIFMLDVSRNFQPKAEIIKMLDLMALYKLNIFCFHLNDDEGWRLEIPGLPELTNVGAQRGYPFEDYQRLQPSYGSGPYTTNKMGSGYYSRRDYIEILRYATTRHIRVIPQVESPGHARAAIKSMLARYYKYKKLGNMAKASQYLLTDLDDVPGPLSNQNYNDNVMNPALPSAYSFVKKVVEELISMYKAAGAPLTMIHMGADEVPAKAWANSPLIKQLMARDASLHSVNDIYHNWFINIQRMLNDKGITLNGAEELAEGTQPTDDVRRVTTYFDFIKNNVRLDAWFNVGGNEGVPYQLANAGYQTFLSNVDYFYFDLTYQKSFYEPGDEWLGLLNTKKVLSFIPYDYYRNDAIAMPGNKYPAGYFDNKEKLTEKGRQNIIGLQGELWAENLKSVKQTEYMLLPRLLALAEKNWAKQPEWENEKDTARLNKGFDEYWNTFANQLGKYELPRLTTYHGGFNFRIPTPGIKVVDGLVQANQQFPGMVMRYTTDGKEPAKNSALFTHPVKLNGNVKVRIFDMSGRGGAGSEIIIN